MGTFRITVEIGDQNGQRFQELEALVDSKGGLARYIGPGSHGACPPC